MVHTNTVTVTTYNTLYEVTQPFCTLKCPNVTARLFSVLNVFSPLPAPDSDGAGVHTGSSQTASRARLHCQDSKPKYVSYVTL